MSRVKQVVSRRSVRHETCGDQLQSCSLVPHLHHVSGCCWVFQGWSQNWWFLLTVCFKCIKSLGVLRDLSNNKWITQGFRKVLLLKHFWNKSWVLPSVLGDLVDLRPQTQSTCYLSPHLMRDPEHQLSLASSAVCLKWVSLHWNLVCWPSLAPNWVARLSGTGF